MQMQEIIDKVKNDPELLNKVKDAAANGKLAELAKEFGLDAESAQVLVSKLIAEGSDLSAVLDGKAGELLGAVEKAAANPALKDVLGEVGKFFKS